jgi:hypothetical protein
MNEGRTHKTETVAQPAQSAGEGTAFASVATAFCLPRRRREAAPFRPKTIPLTTL